jgi:hypothetical protein
VTNRQIDDAGLDEVLVLAVLDVGTEALVLAVDRWGRSARLPVEPFDL